MRPSLEQVTSKPFLAPSSVTVVSQMLSLPSLRFTTSCSNPEDLVKTRRDFFDAENKRCGSVRHAVAAVMLRTKVRRSKRAVISNLNATDFIFGGAPHCIPEQGRPWLHFIVRKSGLRLVRFGSP